NEPAPYPNDSHVAPPRSSEPDENAGDGVSQSSPGSSTSLPTTPAHDDRSKEHPCEQRNVPVPPSSAPVKPRRSGPSQSSKSAATPFPQDGTKAGAPAPFARST